MSTSGTFIGTGCCSLQLVKSSSGTFIGTGCCLLQLTISTNVASMRCYVTDGVWLAQMIEVELELPEEW